MAKRYANFTPEDETLLVSLVEKYKSIVECKKSGSAWKNIESEFNSRSGRSFRSMKNLKEKFANLKKNTKLKSPVNRLNVLKTGCGFFTPKTDTNIDVAIKNLIGDQIHGLESQFDDDSVMPEMPESANTTIIQVEEDALQNTEDIFEAIVDNGQEGSCLSQLVEANNWSSYSAKSLLASTSNKLKTKNKTSTLGYIHQNKNSKKYVGINHQLVQEKLEFVRIQKLKFLEEHELRMELLKLKIAISKKKLDE